jgi:hypothetical protein
MKPQVAQARRRLGQRFAIALVLLMCLQAIEIASQHSCEA